MLYSFFVVFKLFASKKIAAANNKITDYNRKIIMLVQFLFFCNVCLSFISSVMFNLYIVSWFENSPKF